MVDPAVTQHVLYKISFNTKKKSKRIKFSTYDCELQF